MARIQNGSTQSTWKLLSTSLAANSKDLPHLEGHRIELADTLAKTEDLTLQIAALTASKQEATKQLEGLMVQGRKLATYLRVGVKQNYGNRSEKLVEFGVQPLRVHRKAAKAPAPTPAPAPVPTPANTTPSTTIPSTAKPAVTAEAPVPADSGH